MIETIAVTKYGSLRGEIRKGVHTFKGIPYASAPIGKLRFKPPVPPEKWEGVRDALKYGNRAIQGAAPFVPPDKDHIKYLQAFGSLQKGNKFAADEESPESEDCLYLNLWTPALNDGGKRAVMVWCHGGGFTQGSGEGYWRDGTNLAALHNVVVISFNHRLNVFGNMYLADCEDPYYKDCVNVGLQDMAAVISWVHENIESFGGDPDNVLVFGESGGGQKASVLTIMPQTKGRVHKAISMSGGYFTMPTAPTVQASHEILAELGLKSDNLEKLSKLSTSEIYKAYTVVCERHKQGADFGFEMGPVTDGTIMPCSPFSEDFGEYNKDVLFMAGTTKDDGRLEGAMNGCLFDAQTKEEVKSEMVKMHVSAGDVDQAYEDYVSMLPEGRKTPSDVLFAYITDLRFRQAAIRQAEIRAAHGCAPVYMYTFSCDSPDENLRSVHGCEIPFMFHNLEYSPNVVPVIDEAHDHLQDLYSSAVTNFAKTGNPNCEGLPFWPEYDVDRRASMDFDLSCTEQDDPMKKGRELMHKVDYTK